MKFIRELFAKDIERRIEEVIKVDQADEATVYEELQEYVITQSIGQHFVEVYRAMADAASEPHEGIGVWVSGFFGSGKSSFAKILGYTVSNRTVKGESASEIIKKKARSDLDKDLAEELSNYLDFINTKIPTHAIIFDVSMDRGVRYANERLTEIMYKALLRELGYAEDFDLAELEITLEEDGLLEEFKKEFLALHGKPWEIRRKLAMAINEASAVLHRLKPDVYNQPDSWIKALGSKGRADITPNLLADRAFELAARRKPGHALLFVIDEVGQYVARSEEKMLDLQAVVQALGREGKNRVKAKKAIAPFWIVVTSQEKLGEVVDALDSKKIELARLQDRFPTTIDLKQSDISEIAGKRVLMKNPQGAQHLREIYDNHEGRLNNLCSMERTSRSTKIGKEDFVSLYPYLPYQIDLCIDIVSGLRLRRGAHRHVGGSNRTIIKQAQQMMIHPRTRLADEPIGTLVTLDKVYELLYAGDLLPSETTREVDDVANRLAGDVMAQKVVKAIALLEVITDLPRTPRNLAAVLHPRVDSEPLEGEVKAALERLEKAQIVKETEEGYKLLTLQEKNWDDTRKGISPKPADKNRIKREFLKEIFSEPEIKNYRYKGRKAFPFSLTIDGENLGDKGMVPLELLVADDPEEFEEKCAEARKRSSDDKGKVFWVMSLNDEIHGLIEELYRSREMISRHEQIAARGKLSGDEVSCLNEEKIRRDRIQRELRNKLTEALSQGAGFFQGVRKDASSLGHKPGEVFSALREEVIPELYPKFELGSRPVKGEEAKRFLTASNLNGLSAIFYDPPEGLNLVVSREGKLHPNPDAEICREVMDYLNRMHNYGEKITGKTLENHFGGLGYAWDLDVLMLVLAVLFRGGAIEVTYGGKKLQAYNDPSSLQVFDKKQAFRSATFAPKKPLDLKLLGDAARKYEEITGEHAEQVEEGYLARAFQELASEDRDILRPLIERMEAEKLPGLDSIREFLTTVENILVTAPDDCVKTLASEGTTYRELRQRVRKLRNMLTTSNLELIRRARMILEVQYPLLVERIPGDEIEQAARDLREALNSERLYEYLDPIKEKSEIISQRYRGLYEELHERRNEAYSKAIDRVKGTPEWGQLSKDYQIAETRLAPILQPLTKKACQELSLSDWDSVCANCGATLGQMESDLQAVDSLVSRAMEELQRLVSPEKKVKRFKVSSILGGALETQEDLEEAIQRLKEELAKLLSEGVKVILE